eukprot:2728126-Rhodomonas_salina.1
MALSLSGACVVEAQAGSEPARGGMIQDVYSDKTASPCGESEANSADLRATIRTKSLDSAPDIQQKETVQQPQICGGMGHGQLAGEHGTEREAPQDLRALIKRKRTEQQRSSRSGSADDKSDVSAQEPAALDLREHIQRRRQEHCSDQKVQVERTCTIKISSGPDSPHDSPPWKDGAMPEAANKASEAEREHGKIKDIHTAPPSPETEMTNKKAAGNSKDQSAKLQENRGKEGDPKRRKSGDVERKEDEEKVRTDKDTKN